MRPAVSVCVCVFLIQHSPMWCMSRQTTRRCVCVCRSLMNGQWNKSRPYSLSLFLSMSLTSPSCFPLSLYVILPNTQITQTHTHTAAGAHTLSLNTCLCRNVWQDGNKHNFKVQEVHFFNSSMALQKRKTPGCVCVCVYLCQGLLALSESTCVSLSV